MNTIFIKFDKETRVSNNGDYDTRPSEYKFEDGNIEVRDEYHSMEELYDHRMALNIALCNMIQYSNNDIIAYKSKFHSDDTMFENYFIVGIEWWDSKKNKRQQISYHYKLEHWDKFQIPEFEKANKWDGHNSQDVIERLMKL